MGMEEEEKVWLHCVVGAKVEVVDEDNQEGPDGQDGAWVDVDGDADAEGGETNVSIGVIVNLPLSPTLRFAPPSYPDNNANMTWGTCVDHTTS